MSVLIDTRCVPARDRVEYWTSTLDELYHPLHISRDDSPGEFHAQMRGDSLTSIGVFRLAASQNTMRRTQSDISAADPECLHLHILLRGRLYGEQGTRSCVLGPGDITTYDTSAPVLFRAPDEFDLLVLKLPKVSFGRNAARLSRLTALRIPGHKGLPWLAAQFFRSVGTGLNDGTIGSHDGAVTDEIIQLVLRLYLNIDGEPARRAEASEPLARAKAFIDANLSDPDLDPGQVARACFISIRYLHRLFAVAGTSVSNYIRNERLVRCRQDLLDPSFADESVAVIGARWGLPNASHFSRVFRLGYGSSPGQFRREAHLDPLRVSALGMDQTGAEPVRVELSPSATLA
jgi:AraC-like DNA-binding protein